MLAKGSGSCTVAILGSNATESVISAKVRYTRDAILREMEMSGAIANYMAFDKIGKLSVVSERKGKIIL